MMAPRVVKAALVFFVIGATLGAGFALLGPVALIRVLGLVALACASAGCALHLALLRRFHPRTWHALRARFAAQPVAPPVGVLHSAVLAPRPATPAWTVTAANR
jgi:hypothetical protein